MSNEQRVIYEFEGGATHLFWENKDLLNLFGDGYKADATRPIVLEYCKNNGIFLDLKVIPSLDAIAWEVMPLFNACEECDECDESTCPRPIEEVGSKGSGMELKETLEGWFIDFGKCEPWIECNCCNGTGYLNKPRY